MKSNTATDKIIAYKFWVHLFEARTLLSIYFDHIYKSCEAPS